MPACRWIVVPHPIGRLTRAELGELAESALPDIVEALTG